MCEQQLQQMADTGIIAEHCTQQSTVSCGAPQLTSPARKQSVLSRTAVLGSAGHLVIIFHNQNVYESQLYNKNKQI